MQGTGMVKASDKCGGVSWGPFNPRDLHIILGDSTAPRRTVSSSQTPAHSQDLKAALTPGLLSSQGLPLGCSHCAQSWGVPQR